MLHYIGTRTIEDITTRYGPFTRTLPEEIIRYNYAEYGQAQALTHVLHQGRSFNMVSTCGSWKGPKKVEWTAATFPPAPPTYNYLAAEPNQAAHLKSSHTTPKGVPCEGCMAGLFFARAISRAQLG